MVVANRIEWWTLIWLLLVVDGSDWLVAGRMTLWRSGHFMQERIDDDGGDNGGDDGVGGGPSGQC